jgi:hypothetical protein
MAAWWLSPTAGCLSLCLAAGLSACGVSTETYTRTVQERDQLLVRTGQAESEAATQRRQLDALRKSLTEQQQANRALETKVSELEAQTADQNLAQEALAQQLRTLTAEREELLLKQDEPHPPFLDQPAAGGGGVSPEVEAAAQRLTDQLHDSIAAGHLTIHRLSRGLDLHLTESFLFIPNTTRFTPDGQRLLSSMGSVVSSLHPRRVQLRLTVPPTPVAIPPEQAGNNRVMAAARLLALARQFGGSGVESSELVLVMGRQQPSKAPAADPAPAQPMTAEEIQLLLEWPEGR